MSVLLMVSYLLAAKRRKKIFDSEAQRRFFRKLRSSAQRKNGRDF